MTLVGQTGGCGQTTGHLQCCSAELGLGGDLPSHHLCSWDRGIPAASTAACRDHCPTQNLLGDKATSPCQGFPSKSCQGRAGPTTLGDPNPRQAELLPLPKRSCCWGSWALLRLR